ncbi:MAG TPA: hypothetical protein PLN18_02140, partial [Candidatus Colwellbacteria bacterium]|nr:hypothetical protein [Candidatus Colwellbacteria bacterium]
ISLTFAEDERAKNAFLMMRLRFSILKRYWNATSTIRILVIARIQRRIRISVAGERRKDASILGPSGPKPPTTF